MLEIGTKAPGFSVKDHNGNTVSLDDFSGKKVVLWFYPKADTPGCTMEGKGFRDGILHSHCCSDLRWLMLKVSAARNWALKAKIVNNNLIILFSDKT